MAELIWEPVWPFGRKPMVRLDFTLDEAEDLAHMYGAADGCYREIMDVVDKARAGIEYDEAQDRPGLVVRVVER